MEKQESFKLQFIGQGLCPWTPPKNFLKKVLWNLKNFQKGLFINVFLKVLEGCPEGNFFQEVSLWRSPAPLQTQI